MEAIARENDFYRASLDGFDERRFAGQEDWLRRLREQAMERFSTLGFPSSKEEAWKYTRVAPIARVPFATAEEDEEAARPEPARGSLVFVNGHWARELSAPGLLPGGVRVASLKDVLAKEPGLAEKHLGQHADFTKSAFTALNTASFSDGAFVQIPTGAVLSDPISLVFLSRGRSVPSVSHVRNLILAGPGSQAAVVESYAGEDGADGQTLTNAVSEVVLEEGAILEHSKLQKESLSAFHVQTLQVAQGRSTFFTSHNVCLGASLARTDVNVLFGAEGAECALNGLFLAGGSQHVDNHTLIDHAVPHCSSRELYKGILDGRARGVFHGKIVVRPGAQKTDAVQTNRNLLLSREALVNSTPALEILADDVKCRHGSTIGQLDAGALFYLRSRGIGEKEARAILAYGFAADVAARIRIPSIRAEIEAALGLVLGRPEESA